MIRCIYRYIFLLNTLSGGKSCLVAPGVAVPPWATETVLSPRLAADEDKVSHVLSHVVWWKYIYIYIYIYKLVKKNCMLLHLSSISYRIISRTEDTPTASCSEAVVLDLWRILSYLLLSMTIRSTLIVHVLFYISGLPLK